MDVSQNYPFGLILWIQFLKQGRASNSSDCGHGNCTSHLFLDCNLSLELSKCIEFFLGKYSERQFSHIWTTKMFRRESIQGISFVNDDAENDRYYTLPPLPEKPVASLKWNTLQCNLQSGGIDIFKEQCFF